MHIDKELDARGLVLRTTQSLAGMIRGQTLRIIATDPGSVIDFQVFADQTGNELLSMSESADEFIFILKKK